MKIILLLTQIFLFISSAYAQKIDTVFFNENYTSISGSYNPVYKLIGNEISYRSKTAKIKIPPNLDSKNLAFSFSFFDAQRKGKFQGDIALLLDGYNDYKSSIYFDYNQNLDFTDDGPPQILNNKKDSIIISYYNSDKTRLLLRKGINFATYRDDQDKKMVEEFYLNHEHGKKNEFLDSEFWLRSYGYNSLTKEAIINGDTIPIGIHDWNLNGVYNEKGIDRILTAENEFNWLTYRLAFGGYVYKDSTIIKLSGKNYEVLDVEESGKYMVIVETDKKSKALQVGEVVPDLQVKLIDGSKKMLHDLLQPEKYNLLDFWGTWCKPCIKQTPKLLRLDSLYGTKLNIIALAHNDKKKNIEAYISKHTIPWINGYSNIEIHKAFMVDGWPTLVLIDENKQLIGLKIQPDKVEEHLQQFEEKEGY
jgi:thiol-disulfide isomerase/thioredoxin